MRDGRHRLDDIDLPPVSISRKNGVDIISTATASRRFAE